METRRGLCSPDALVNKKRAAAGQTPANFLWLWGQGRRLELDTIEKRFGLSGGVISAVDLIKGIGVAAGLKSDLRPRRHRLHRHQLPRQGGGGPRGAGNP